MAHQKYWGFGTSNVGSFRVLDNPRIQFDDHMPVFDFVTQNGSRYQYRHAYQDRVRVTITHVSCSDATWINSWWGAGQSGLKLFKRNGHGASSVTYVGTNYRLVNPTRPLGRLHAPFVADSGFYSGTLILQGGK